MSRPHKPVLVNLAWTTALAGLFAVGYMLSYPLAFRFVDSDSDGKMIAYGPVEWLMDETFVGRPMLWWADLCGTYEAVRHAWIIRNGWRFTE